MRDEFLHLLLKLGAVDEGLARVEEERDDLGVEIIFGGEDGAERQVVELR